jgi:Prokaryotic N-terminal methylation motif
MKTRAKSCGEPVTQQTLAAGGALGGRGGGRGWRGRAQAAFTLLEVMIAAAIFFMGMFALLGVLSNGLHAAAILQKNCPTASMAVAEYTLHDQLEEGSTNGDFTYAGENIYPDYRWELNTRELMTNGLFQVDVIVYHESKVFSSMQILLFRPDSKRKF